MSTTRVTLTMDQRVVEETRAAGVANFSRLVNQLLADYTASLRRQRLREDLRLGCLAEAEADLDIAFEYRFVDREAADAEDDRRPTTQERPAQN